MFVLDYKSRLPIYEQLYRSITRMAALGAMEQGESLPSVRSLAQELGVNPNTVQKAYQMLERDGIIFSVQGKGSFLAGDESAVARRKQLTLEKVRDAVTEAAACGVTKKEVLAQISGAYEGKEEQHD
ncbi:MAG: GntR family transcriptional regulator [Oscillospiraceae bacterium]|jgi:GntR family transcriptional regulator|nr:GntR family transcriptional regulator [Oscillospiraceae bacterium]